MECGARHFAFVSRSGMDKSEAARLVADIQQSGASTQVLRADAADECAVAEIVASLQAERPIRGVVHAAMILKVSSLRPHDFINHPPLSPSFMLRHILCHLIMGSYELTGLKTGVGWHV